jgi:hypothetical protein
MNTVESYSPVFTVQGERQSVGSKVKYSKNSQKYKKSSVKLTIATTRAYTCKATIYDGKKKLKTIQIRNGRPATYSLPKKLKPGTHKITVKFTANEEFTNFYAVHTTKAKKIKVTK